MAKLISSERFEGIGFEIAKVVFIFSLVAEVLVCLVGAYTGDSRYVPLILLLLLVPVYSVIIRRLIKNFFLFFLAHAALIGLIFLYHDILPMVIIGAFVAVDVVYIYVRKISGVNDPMSTVQLMVAFGVALVLYYFVGQVGAEFTRPIIITIFIFQIVIYLIYFHQMNMHDTLSANTQSANQSIKKINSLNNKVILMFIVILLILIAAGVLLRFDVVISMIGQGLFAGLRLLVRLLFRGGSSSSELPQDTEEVAQGGDDAPLDLEGYEPWKIWLILEKIMIVVCIIGAIIAIGYILYRLYQKFKMDRVEEDMIGDYAETTLFIERVKPEKKERRTLAELFSMPNDKKVRRIYQKKVQHRIKAGDPITQTKTPQEICSVVKAEDLSGLTAMYEKARYSDIPITKEDVQSIQ